MIPQSDDYMTYDERTGRFILTTKDLLDSVGLDLRSRIGEGATVNPEIAISRFLKLASDQVYAYIHKFNRNNKRQDEIIAKTVTGREIIKQAMEYQALYLASVGYLGYSVKPDERAARLDELVKETLLTSIPEAGNICILYTGWLG